MDHQRRDAGTSASSNASSGSSPASSPHQQGVGSTGDRQQQQQPQQQPGSGGNSSSSKPHIPASTTSLTLAGSAAGPSTSTAARRHPSTSSSLSNVTNYIADEEEAGQEEEDDDADALDSENGALNSSYRHLQSSTSPPPAAPQPAAPQPAARPVYAFTRAGSGLPLAWEPDNRDHDNNNSYEAPDRSMTDSPGSYNALRPGAGLSSSGIAQQRPSATNTEHDNNHAPAFTSEDGGRPSPSLNMAFSNITHRRPHASSTGAYSHSSTSSFASSSSSPPSSTNTPGSARIGTGAGGGHTALSEGTFSPATSVGTGVGSSGAAAGLHSRQHSQQSPTLPISIASSSQLANIGIGISSSTSSPLHQASSVIPTTSTVGASKVPSPTASPALAGPASLPPLSSIQGAATSPAAAPPVQSRLSTTPFLPSPLAQASLAPGEEEGEHLEMFGLDAAITEQERKGFSPTGTGNWRTASGGTSLPGGERAGRSPDIATTQFASAAGYSAPTVLRRSTSVSHAAGYKASNSRRRISSISQQQQQQQHSPSSLPFGTSASPPQSSTSPIISPPGSTSIVSTPAAIVAAATQRPGSPSPLRQEASLLSMSRDASLTAPAASARPTTLNHNHSGSSSEASSSNSNGNTHFSPTPRPVEFQHITIPSSTSSLHSGEKSTPTSAGLSSAGSHNSSSGGSPSEYRFPSPHQAVAPGPTSAFRVRQMSISSSGSAASANSAPPRAQATPGSIHHSPTTATKTLSPPGLSAAAMSASSPGLSYHVPSSSHRSKSISMNRGTHGRSESLTSTHGTSSAMSSSVSTASSLGLSTSPSASFRPFPSAPPVATPSLLSSSFNFSPSSLSASGPAISPPGSVNLIQTAVSPSSSISSSMGGRVESSSGGPSSGTAGGIRLQRVPTSVRLAQELHPVSPAIEKRRLSVDPSTMSPAMAPSTSSMSAFKIGGGLEESASSNSSGSETEYRHADGTISHLGLKLPATPMATRRNTPSPGAVEREERDLGQEGENPDDAQFARPRAPQQKTGLASPFHSQGSMQYSRQRSPSGSPSKTSPTTSLRSLSIPTPPMSSSSAYAPLFPFSMPRSAARSSLASSLTEPGTSSSPATLSRSHSRSHSKGQGSPVMNRLSPRMSSDPFGETAGSYNPGKFSQHAETAVSPKTANFATSSSQTYSGPLAKRNTISGLGPSMSASSIYEPALTSVDSPMAGSLSPPFMSPRASAATGTVTSPASIKKQFRTSMMPGSISTSSTEDYARHLQESRASKLRKWATGMNQSHDQFMDIGGAGNTFGAGSDVQAAGKIRRRARIPDFSGFDLGSERGDHRDELAGDLGVRPGTAGSREIEWVDWLDEYKKMKEAKIRAEEEQQRQEGLDNVQEAAEGLANVEEAAETDGEDIAREMETSAAVHTRAESAEYVSSHDPGSRKGSSGNMDDTTSRTSQESNAREVGSTIPPRARRLSTASLASLSLLDASKRKRASQDWLGNTSRPAVPPPIVARKPLVGRSVSYAPPTTYSSMRQEEPQAPSAQPKKRKNIASKIDSWWSAVTKSFTSASDDKKSPPPPPMTRPMLASGPPQLPELPPLTTDQLMPVVSIDQANFPGRTSAYHAGQDSTLPIPPAKLRHTASASDLTPEKKVYGGGQLPMGALAPAAKVPTYYDQHHRLNSAGSDGDGSSASGGTSKNDFKRRNPQLSLRLDPRFQPAGTAHRLGERRPPMAARTSSTSLSSASGPPAALSTDGVFKEPRLPAALLAQHSEHTPNLTPGQSPIWDKTPGLVPLSQGQDLALVRTISQSSALHKSPAPPAVTQAVAPSFSMSHIREHIKHRLSGAKHNCDKELKKIINGITVYVEKELDNERAFASGLISRQEEDIAGEDPVYSESPAAVFSNEESDAGNEAGDEFESRLIGNKRPALSHATTSSSNTTDPPHSGMGSPTLSFAQQGQRHSPQGPVSRRGRTSGHVSPRRMSMPSKRQPLGAPVRPADLAARLERSLDLDKTATIAGSSRTTSTSTSRSRSPMPMPRRGSAVNRNSSAEWFKKQDAPEEDDKRSFLHSLQEIVAVAMEIQDTSVTDLTDDPTACAHLIRRVQKIGQRWDDHPNWPLRGWYVQLLLAVAGLSRVAEFWAEERGFWNFEDQKESTDNDPILFVAKATPQEDDISVVPHARSRAASTVLGLSRMPARDERLSSAPPPLGIDLGVHEIEEDAPGDTSMKVSGPVMVLEESSRAEEAEVLREAVEEVRSATILMELALDGESFQYLSPVWEDVVGLPPNVCLGRPISHLLHPDDAAVFSEASKHLQIDDSHTVEAQFRLRVFSEREDPDDHTDETFEAMEGKGMLIRDRMHGGPSHTMWVIRPVPTKSALSDDGEAITVRPPTASYIKAFSETTTPFTSGRLPTAPILCRICDRQIPTWFFEKHNETCNETHRLDVDIGETNDKLADFRTTVVSILDAVNTISESSEATSPPEYQDLPLLPGRYRESQAKFLEEVLETLAMAIQISTPALSDEHLPVEEQTLLSPRSEDRLSSLQDWEPPKSEDPALRKLGEDLADLIRQKTTVVNRLRNTIVYVERIRLEWEAQAQILLAGEPRGLSSSQSPPPSPAPTILPSTIDATTAIVKQHVSDDLHEQPTPVASAPSTFLGGPPVISNHRTSSRQSFNMEDKSPATLVQPLPMIDNDGLKTALGQCAPLSPSLLPTSPRLPAAAPVRNAKASTSIKDFDIIKPISKGAFGSVYLAKKRNTGDYYAIKVLKKADMIAKNQVTNVKAERKIMMTQADSDFAVKLYWTFQSKDYLYLVMEYLNGGDCASLIKVIGCLDEDWAKSYIAEIVLGLEYLHSRGIVHRDLKPDNLLIDSRGHLRLTDFGLSRFGLLGRQARTINQSASQLSKRLHRRAIPKSFPQAPSEMSTPDYQSRASYFGSITLEDADVVSESSGSESVPDKQKTDSRNSDSPAISLGSNSGKLLPHVTSPGKQSDSHRFVGTVDYVAPESILGVGVGEGVDWVRKLYWAYRSPKLTHYLQWALGVICHEFLTAFPPFHAETPEQVFDNILSRRIDWHDDEVEWSAEARDFVDKLLCPDSSRRLGAKGAEEVKRHPFLRGINWTKLREAEANFVPQVADPESTDYFDDRGAATQVFEVDHAEPEIAVATVDGTLEQPEATASVEASRRFDSRGGTPADDFGTFNFKNLDVLKQANDDVIRKLRHDQLIPPVAEVNAVSSVSRKSKPKRNSIAEHRTGQPPSPSTSTTSSLGSSFSRPSLPTTPFAVIQSHKRRTSNQAGPRFKHEAQEGEADSSERRNSMPAYMRRASFGTMEKQYQQSEGPWHQRRKTSGHTEITPASSISLANAGKLSRVSDQGVSSNLGTAGILHASEKTVDCLIAEDNPISSKILETILVRLGCLCVVVHNGEEAIRCSMGEIAFDVIFMDMLMPILDGENAARMIKSTNNANQNTPIVAVTSYAAHERTHITEEGTLFNAVLTKPVSKADVLNVLTKLGFVAKTRVVTPALGDNTIPDTKADVAVMTVSTQPEAAT